MSKKIVILANSRKLSGRCVAAKDENGTWIRLTKVNHNPIPIREAISYDMLTVLDVDGLINRPSNDYNYHTENSTYTRVNVLGDLDRTLVDRFIDNPNDIFGTGKHVSEFEAQRLRQSLLFVKVTDFCIYMKDGGQYADKLRGEFTYNNRVYSDIAVTDSAVEQRLKRSSYPYQEAYREAYITISLGEIFNGYAYKLISGIYIP